MLHPLLVRQLLRVVRGDVPRRAREEASRTHRGVEDAVVERGLHQLNHHSDDVAWRAELAVLAGRLDAVEQVLVHVAHHVLAGKLHRLDLRHGNGQHLWLVNLELRIHHVAAERAVAPRAERLHEREHEIAHDAVHLVRRLVAEVLPAQIRVGDFHVRVFAHHAKTLPENRILQRRVEKVRVTLLNDLIVVQKFHEDEERDLLHDGKRIRRLVRPERVPDSVYRTFCFS